ncbi:MAG: lysine-sensitive aspartokinase 3 [Gemmatimonadales bacterium]
MIVCKFGGTSVGTAEAIARLVEIVGGRRGEAPVVVVSALSGVTDQLLGLGRLLGGEHREERATRLETIRARHAGIAGELSVPAEALAPIEAELTALGRWLDERRAPSLAPADLDHLAAHGERWSSRLIVAAMGQRGLPAEWVDARQVIVTDGSFTRARPATDAIRAQAGLILKPILTAGRIPVIQGFVGGTADGRTTTLGRGGSDYTASLLGAALHVDRVEIWTDVDGIMTADPRIVPNARVLPVASHVEAAELAAFGAKVLHPATQAPLVEARIPCVVLNSFAPDRAGTTVVSGLRPGPIGNSPVRSISFKRGVTVVNIRAAEMPGAVGFLRRLFEVIERHGAAVDVISTSEINVSFTLDDVTDLAGLAADLGQLGEVTVYERRAIVAVIGVGLRGTRGLSGRLFSAIREVNVEMISQGASEINVTLVVQEEDGPSAVRMLHAEFFAEEG